ncbi:hypothetical protein KIPB_016691, partial [Kipferlia bialata]|eukprot:g16691.t1
MYIVYIYIYIVFVCNDTLSTLEDEEDIYWLEALMWNSTPFECDSLDDMTETLAEGETEDDMEACQMAPFAT